VSDDRLCEFDGIVCCVRDGVKDDVSWSGGFVV